MPIGAIIGAGALAAGGAAYAGKTQADAANNATATQSQMYSNSLAQQQKYYNNAVATETPLLNQGTSILSGALPGMQQISAQQQGAVTSLAQLYGINSLGQPGGTPFSQSALQAFTNTPGYQFTLGQGTAALQNSAAAKGGLIGGNTQMALANYGQGLASQTFQNMYVNPLQQLASMGLGATGALGTLGANMATSAGNSIVNAGTGASGQATQAGTAAGQQMGASQIAAGAGTASGIVGGTNAFNSALANYALLNKLGTGSSSSSFSPGTAANGGWSTTVTPASAFG